MFNSQFKIYLITNLINNKKYIGITKNSLKERFYYHCHSNSCRILSKAIKKYNSNNFKMEVIFYAKTLEDMINLEDYFIKQFNTLSPSGYNLREGGQYGKFSFDTKNIMSKNTKNRWKTPEKMQLAKKALKTYTEQKKEPVIGIHIKDGSILKFPTIQKARESSFFVSSCLSRKSKYAHDHIWFYDEGFSDQFYKDLAEIQLNGFGNYSKGKNSWKKCNKEDRIKAIKASSAYRAKPIIGINRFDFSILEFDSISSYIKAGYSWGSLSPVLKEKARHAHNYCWFYKEHENIELYKEEARKRLGNKHNIK